MPPMSKKGSQANKLVEQRQEIYQQRTPAGGKNIHVYHYEPQCRYTVVGPVQESVKCRLLRRPELQTSPSLYPRMDGIRSKSDNNSYTSLFIQQ